LWTFTIQVVDRASATYPCRVTLNEESMWKVRELLVACGMTVPKKRIKVDPEKLIGKELGMVLEDDEYEGKMKSVIDSVFPASDLDNDTDGDDEVDEEDEEEPAPRKKAPAKKTATKKAPAKDEDDDEDEDLDELDIDDL
jgi:hypothetical protein